MNRRVFLASAVAAIGGAKSIARGSGRDEANETAERLLDRISRDPLRPQYHLLPQAGFVGDPCAPRFVGGENHVFFHGSFGGRGWSHARGSDLIYWEHMPKALTPSAESYDSYGTFTGSVLPGGPGASIIYTGVTKVRTAQETIRNEGLREVQCVATTSDKDLRTWHKLDRPVIEAPPAAPSGSKVVGFRDPFAWQDGDTWYAGVGSGFEHIGGCVLLYHSKDARIWEYLHPVAQGKWNEQIVSNPVGSGEMWECPDLFPLGSKHVLIYSTEHKVVWHVGTLDKREMRFYSEQDGLIDRGAYYAPKSMLDGKGRRILWGWVQERRADAEIRAAGWSGSISLPRVLSVSSQGRLHMEVVPELGSLRSQTVTITGPKSADTFAARLRGAVIKGRCGEIVWKFNSRETELGGFEINLRTTGGAAPFLSVRTEDRDGIRSAIIGDQAVPLSPNQNGLSTIHIWIDNSIIETFVDGADVVTSRVYVSPQEQGDVQLIWSGSTQGLREFTVSRIQPISKDRLTS
jgi:beta-fructofuranosidase